MKKFIRNITNKTELWYTQLLCENKFLTERTSAIHHLILLLKFILLYLYFTCVNDISVDCWVLLLVGRLDAIKKEINFTSYVYSKMITRGCQAWFGFYGPFCEMLQQLIEESSQQELIHVICVIIFCSNLCIF